MSSLSVPSQNYPATPAQGFSVGAWAIRRAGQYGEYAEPSRGRFLAHALLGLPAGIIVPCLYRIESRRAGIFHMLHSIWVPAVMWPGLLALVLYLGMGGWYVLA